MMMLCIDLDKVSEKDSRLRVPWSLAPKYGRLSILEPDSSKPLNTAPITKMPRLLALAVHAFMELSPAMW